ncbi:hypothetical protein [Tsukamurella soli]|uniref:hypothetical protein n=1 Tax=Tsukamurella soli TaxID=644556 RepID=UPI00361895AC
MAKIPDYVTVRETAAGRRYEVRIEVGGADGKRRQQRRRFRTLQAAKDAYAEGRGDRSRGTQVSPTELTLRQAIDSYLDALHVRPTTLTGYVCSLRPAVAVLGDRPVQSLRREDFEKLVRDLQAGECPRPSGGSRSSCGRRCRPSPARGRLRRSGRCWRGCGRCSSACCRTAPSPGTWWRW